MTEQPGKQYQIKMAVTEDLKDDPNDYSWVNSLYQRIQVLDVKGNPMQIYQNSLSGQSFNHAEMLVTYGSAGGAKPEPPGKIVYQTWITRQEKCRLSSRICRCREREDGRNAGSRKDSMELHAAHSRRPLAYSRLTPLPRFADADAAAQPLEFLGELRRGAVQVFALGDELQPVVAAMPWRRKTRSNGRRSWA